MIEDVVTLISYTLISMTPLVLASTGEVITEKSGVVNIGLEGILTLSAFTSTLVTFFTDNPYLGVLVGTLVGTLSGMLHGFISAYLRGNQIIAGVGFNTFAYGISVMGLISVWEQHGASPGVNKIPHMYILLSSNVRLAVPPLTLVAIAIALATWWWLYRTSSGLKLRACGEDPHAAEAMGVDVLKVRFVATTLGGALAGLGGAYLVLGWVGQFTRHISAGRGFIALANVAFSNWNPAMTVVGGMIFGFFDVLSLYLPVKIQVLYPGVNITAFTYLFRTIPYLGTLGVVVAILKKVKMPRALGRPYIKE